MAPSVRIVSARTFISDTFLCDGTWDLQASWTVAALQQTPFDVLATLVSTVRDLGQPGRDDFFGHGLINAALAVKQTSEAIFRDGFESGDASRWSSTE